MSINSASFLSMIAPQYPAQEYQCLPEDAASRKVRTLVVVVELVWLASKLVSSQAQPFGAAANVIVRTHVVAPEFVIVNEPTVAPPTPAEMEQPEPEIDKDCEPLATGVPQG